MEGETTTIKVLGTNHISAHSAKEIQSTVEKFEPDIIAVELDKRRLQSLFERQKGGKQQLPKGIIRQIGITGFLFLLIGGYVQKKLAGVVKVEPGVDMLAAVKIAKERELPLVLADRDILVTLKRLSKAFTWREKFRVVGDIIFGPFRKEKIHIQLDKVPSAEVIRKVMKLMEERYPALYNVLVIERNVYMAMKMDALSRAKPGKKVLLVVGAGHEEDLRERIGRSDRMTIV